VQCRAADCDGGGLVDVSQRDRGGGYASCGTCGNGSGNAEATEACSRGGSQVRYSNRSAMLPQFGNASEQGSITECACCSGVVDIYYFNAVQLNVGRHRIVVSTSREDVQRVSTCAAVDAVESVKSGDRSAGSR